MVSIALDAQGATKARPYVERAGATFTTLVDESNLLSRLLGFKAVPNGVLVDEHGRLCYQKYGGFDIRKAEYAAVLEEWLRNPVPAPAAEQQISEADTSKHETALAHFQRGLEHYKRGDAAQALVEWKMGRDLEPDNWVIRKQIWAVEHPEKFYEGDVDYAWQREQVRKGS